MGGPLNLVVSLSQDDDYGANCGVRMFAILLHDDDDDDDDDDDGRTYLSDD